MNTSTSPKTESAPRLRPAPLDAAVVLAILALAVLLFWAFLPKGSSGDLVCTVSQNGQVLDEFPLNETAASETRAYGDYVLSCDGAQVRLLSAPCANQDCVHTGAIRRSRQSIVCLPGRFIVELSSVDGADPGFDIVVK